MSMNRWWILIGALIIGIASVVLYQQKCPSNYIPLTVLFGNPSHILPKISPDGSSIAYLAPLKGVLNIWVRTRDKQDDHPITFNKSQGIHNFSWTYDSKTILYASDTEGNENFRLYGVNITTHRIIDFTPFENITVGIVEYHKEFPYNILISMNKRDERYHDVYNLNLITHDLTLVAENPGNIVSWLADNSLTIRAAERMLPDGGFEVILRDNERSPWKSLGTWTIDDGDPGILINFSKDGSKLRFIDARRSNTAQLVQEDLCTRARTVLAQDAQYDIDNTLLLNPHTDEIQAVGITRDRLTWLVFDEAIEHDMNMIASLAPGDYNIISRDIDDRFWTLMFTNDDTPASFWLYDRATKKGSLIFYSRPELLKYRLAKMSPILCAARDGLQLHGYLTLPIDATAEKRPLIIMVHGGPWLRDTWGYDNEVQWLANRGYVVLQINYRGSSGYGKAFLNAGNKEWAGKMHTDLVDAVYWATEHYPIDIARIGIYGGSYGGYAALVGATFTPDLFACAVDIVGPSNLLSFITTVPPYWTALLNAAYRRIGNPMTEPDFLRSRSPLFFVDAIKIPILIAQGKNDPRVKQAESEQIVAALKKRGISYEYLLFSDEGHGFTKPHNRMIFYTATEKFLSQHLGGNSC